MCQLFHHILLGPRMPSCSLHRRSRDLVLRIWIRLAGMAVAMAATSSQPYWALATRLMASLKLDLLRDFMAEHP